MTRRTLIAYGPKRRTVRVFLEGDLCRVQWREHGRLMTKSWPDTTAGRQEARAWARGFADARESAGTAKKPRTTLRGLWEAYSAAEFPHLRERTQRIYAECWQHFELRFGRTMLADDAKPEMFDLLRAELSRKGWKVNTIRMLTRSVKTVFAFGERRELIARNRLASWRFKLAKEDRPTSPAEYRREDFDRLLAELNPEKRTQWRAHVVLALVGFQGVRQKAALHLQWSDVDLDEKRIRWRAKWDKMGRDWQQPLRVGTVRALEVAKAWHERLGLKSPWVLPADRKTNKEPVYSAQSFWWLLRAVERRAGIPHLPWRAAHGFRRMVAGDVAEITGNAMIGLRSIGDTDMRQADSYLKNREDVTAGAFDRLDSETSNRNQTATEPDLEAVSAEANDAK